MPAASHTEHPQGPPWGGWAKRHPLRIEIHQSQDEHLAGRQPTASNGYDGRHGVG